MGAKKTNFDMQSAKDLLDPAVQKVWVDSGKKVPNLLEGLFYKSSMDAYKYTESFYVGYGEMDFGTESGSMNYDAPIEGFDKTWTQEYMVKATSFGPHVWQWANQPQFTNTLKDKIQNVIGDFKPSYQRTINHLGCEFFANMFNSSFSHTGTTGAVKTISCVGADGQPFIASTHTRVDGGSNINNIITSEAGVVNVEFGYAGLKAAAYTKSLLTDHRGTPLSGMKLNLLVCVEGSTVHLKAKEIKGAIKNNKIPEAFSNDGSAVEDFEILTLPVGYVGTAYKNYWMLMDSSMLDDKVGYQLRVGKECWMTGPETDFETGNIKYKLEAWMTMGFGSSLLALGSKNTNVA